MQHKMQDLPSVDSINTPLLPNGRARSSRLSLGCVMAIQVLHGIAYYTMAPHILSFGTTELGLQHRQAIAISLAFSGVVYVMPLVGGALADTVLGRYRSLLIGICLYFIGTLLMLTLIIAIEVDAALTLHVKIAIYIASLTFIAISRGFVIPNIVPFGAEQIASPTEANVWSYFMWSFFFFDLGKLVAFLPMPLINQVIDGRKGKLLTSAVLQVVTIGGSAAVLICGKMSYVMVTPKGKVTFRRIRQSIINCMFCQLHSGKKPTESASSHEKSRWYNAQLFHKLVLMVGLFATCGVYEAIYFQLTSTYIVQAGHLHNSHQLPELFMNMFTPLFGMLCVPVLEVINRFTSPWRLHDLTIIAIGTFIAVFSPLSAGVLETFAQKAEWLTPEDSGVTVFAQVPQYLVVGLADVLVFSRALKFAYQESPPFIQSSCTGLLFGLGSFVGFLLYIIQTEITRSQEHSIPSNTTAAPIPLHPSRGTSLLEYLFYSLAGLVALVLFTTFIPLSILYRRAKKDMPDKTDEDDIFRAGSISTMLGPPEDLDDQT